MPSEPAAGAGGAAGGAAGFEYELQALNFHSSMCITGEETLGTFEVPDNIYIVTLGTLGGWTNAVRSELGNLGKKIESGQDYLNSVLSNWLKEHYSTPNPEYGEIVLYYPGIHCLDRNLGPDIEARQIGTPEHKIMKYFTNKYPDGLHYGSAEYLFHHPDRSTMSVRPAALLGAGEMLKGAPLSLSAFVNKLSKNVSIQTPNKKIILFILGCQVIPSEADLSLAGFAFANYRKAKVAGNELIKLLPDTDDGSSSPPHTQGEPFNHEGNQEEGELADDGWKEIPDVEEHTTTTGKELDKDIKPYIENEINEIAAKIIEISNEAATSHPPKKMKYAPPQGGKRKRRKTKRKSRRQIGCGIKKKHTRRRRTKRTKKNKRNKKRVTKQKRYKRK
jgi:hypothetical protein